MINTPELLRQAALFLENDDNSVTLNWKQIMKGLHFLLSAGDVYVTDDVYENMFGLNWNNLRYIVKTKPVSRERLVVTKYNEIFDNMSNKYKTKIEN